MSTPNDGGPAFPVTTEACDRGAGIGMSLRDWFAGQALNGWAAGRNNDPAWRDSKPETIACECYKYADSILAAREKGCAK